MREPYILKPTQKRIIRYLIEHGPTPAADIKRALTGSSGVRHTLSGRVRQTNLVRFPILKMMVMGHITEEIAGVRLSGRIGAIGRIRFVESFTRGGWVVTRTIPGFDDEDDEFLGVIPFEMLEYVGEANPGLAMPDSYSVWVCVALFIEHYRINGRPLVEEVS